MKIDELISELEQVKEEHGNLQVSVFGDTEKVGEVVLNKKPVKHVLIDSEV